MSFAVAITYVLLWFFTSMLGFLLGLDALSFDFMLSLSLSLDQLVCVYIVLYFRK